MKEEDVKLMSNKMEKMDELLNKDLFSNPVKEVQKKCNMIYLNLKKFFKKIYLN